MTTHVLLFYNGVDAYQGSSTPRDFESDCIQNGCVWAHLFDKSGAHVKSYFRGRDWVKELQQHLPVSEKDIYDLFVSFLLGHAPWKHHITYDLIMSKVGTVKPVVICHIAILAHSDRYKYSLIYRLSQNPDLAKYIKELVVEFEKHFETISKYLESVSDWHE